MNKLLVISVIFAVLGLAFSIDEEYEEFGEDEVNDICLKCLCHGRSGCYSLTNCAKYSINESYWTLAGSPTVSDEHDGELAYKACVQNIDCIRKTIRGYIQSILNKDCNGDGTVDCKDFAMIHYEGPKCYSPNYNPTYIKRLDSCLRKEMGNEAPANGWNFVKAQ